MSDIRAILCALGIPARAVPLANPGSEARSHCPEEDFLRGRKTDASIEKSATSRGFGMNSRGATLREVPVLYRQKIAGTGPCDLQNSRAKSAAKAAQPGFGGPS